MYYKRFWLFLFAIIGLLIACYESPTNSKEYVELKTELLKTIETIDSTLSKNIISYGVHICINPNGCMFCNFGRGLSRVKPDSSVTQQTLQYDFGYPVGILPFGFSLPGSGD